MASTDEIAENNGGLPPLANLQNPTSEFLHKNYTVGAMRKFLQENDVSGIWITKDGLVTKLLAHYAARANGGVSTNNSTEDVLQEIQTENQELDRLQKMIKKHMKDLNGKLEIVENALAEKSKEIDELKTKLYLADERIETLQKALQAKYGEGEHPNNEDEERSEKILLIGDSTLQEMKSSDLNDNVLIRTLPETNTALLKSWIAEKLDYPLKQCIIYCGFQDLLEEDIDIEKMLDNLGTVVSELKRRNENVQVNICELIPNLLEGNFSDTIDQFNGKLLNWCENNGVSFIETVKFFKLGTGDSDTNCYREDENDVHNCKLNRVGAIRLLDAVASKCQGIVNNQWKNIKKNFSKQIMDSKNVPPFEQNSWRNNNRKVVSRVERSDMTRNSGYTRPAQVRNNGSSQNYEVHFNNRNAKNHRNSYSSPSNVNTAHFRNSTNNENQSRCYFCGESNHHSNRCRYDHKIKCGNCHGLGHKRKHCSFYSNYN